MDRKLTKIFYIVFQVLKVLLIKICKIQSLDLLFLVIFVRFYINRYHFSQVSRTSFNIIWKKDFRHKFSFFSRLKRSSRTRPLICPVTYSGSILWYSWLLFFIYFVFEPLPFVLIGKDQHCFYVPFLRNWYKRTKK